MKYSSRSIKTKWKLFFRGGGAGKTQFKLFGIHFNVDLNLTKKKMNPNYKALEIVVPTGIEEN